jgi:hypothetical protein
MPQFAVRSGISNGHLAEPRPRASPGSAWERVGLELAVTRVVCVAPLPRRLVECVALGGGQSRWWVRSVEPYFDGMTDINVATKRSPISGVRAGLRA